MTTTQEALKMAIEYLEYEQNLRRDRNLEKFAEYYDKPINACKEALEQQEQEPVDVARVQEDGYVEWRDGYDDLPVGTKIYTHPAKQLSDDEIRNIGATIFACKLEEVNDADIEFARAIEAKVRGE